LLSVGKPHAKIAKKAQARFASSEKASRIKGTCHIILLGTTMTQKIDHPQNTSIGVILSYSQIQSSSPPPFATGAPSSLAPFDFFNLIPTNLESVRAPLKVAYALNDFISFKEEKILAKGN